MGDDSEWKGGWVVTSTVCIGIRHSTSHGWSAPCNGVFLGVYFSDCIFQLSSNLRCSVVRQLSRSSVYMLTSCSVPYSTIRLHVWWWFPQPSTGREGRERARSRGLRGRSRLCFARLLPEGWSSFSIRFINVIAHVGFVLFALAVTVRMQLQHAPVKKK